jgi:hypothetical protein
MAIFRIAEGKIAQAWEVYDEAGMWRQLGVTPPPAPYDLAATPVPH